MSQNNNQLRGMLNTGALLEVTIRQGSLGCSDAQDACAEWGHLLLHKRGDNYLIDTPDDENIVFVDSEDYILDIVDEFWEHLEGEITVGEIIEKFPGRKISMLSPGGIVASDNANELLTADAMNVYACSDANMTKEIHYGRICFAVILGAVGSLWVSLLELNNFMTLLSSSLLFFSIYGGYLLIRKEELVIEIWNQGIGIIRKVLQR